MHDTIVVVPSYNEAGRFQTERFRAFAALDPSLCFVLVDDGSSDDTRAVLTSLARTSLEQNGHAQFIVVGLDRNRGKAEAVRAGFSRAFEESPKLIGYFDADLATPLSELAAMRALFNDRPDLVAVLGSRVGLLGREVTRTHSRHYLGRLFASAASFALGLTVYDTQCGAKIFRNSAAVREVFGEPFIARWAFDVEVLARLNALAERGDIPPLSHSAAEHPLQAWRDVAGSKLRKRAILRAGADLARVWLEYRAGWPKQSG